MQTIARRKSLAGIDWQIVIVFRPEVYMTSLQELKITIVFAGEDSRTLSFASSHDFLDGGRQQKHGLCSSSADGISRVLLPVAALLMSTPTAVSRLTSISYSSLLSTVSWTLRRANKGCHASTSSVHPIDPLYIVCASDLL